MSQPSCNLAVYCPGQSPLAGIVADSSVADESITLAFSNAVLTPPLRQDFGDPVLPGWGAAYNETDALTAAGNAQYLNICAGQVIPANIPGTPDQSRNPSRPRVHSFIPGTKRLDENFTPGLPPVGRQCTPHTNTDQFCTVTCPDGTVSTVTTPSGTVIADSAAAANAIAYEIACERARNNAACWEGNFAAQACLGSTVRQVFILRPQSSEVTWRYGVAFGDPSSTNATIYWADQPGIVRALDQTPLAAHPEVTGQIQVLFNTDYDAVIFSGYAGWPNLHGQPYRFWLVAQSSEGVMLVHPGSLNVLGFGNQGIVTLDQGGAPLNIYGSPLQPSDILATPIGGLAPLQVGVSATITSPSFLGNLNPVVISVAGQPPGLTFNSNTSTLSGVPISIGDYTLTWTGRDQITGFECSFTQAVSVVPCGTNDLAGVTWDLSFQDTFSLTAQLTHLTWAYSGSGTDSFSQSASATIVSSCPSPYSINVTFNLSSVFGGAAFGFVNLHVNGADHSPGIINGQIVVSVPIVPGSNLLKFDFVAQAQGGTYNCSGTVALAIAP